MTKFYTPYNPAPRKSAPTGDMFRETFGQVIDEDGNLTVDKTGIENMYQMTQEAKPASLYDLIESSQVDPVLLRHSIDVNEEMIQDFTSMPRTLAEAHNLILRGQRAYDSLPVEVRDEFGSAGKMMSSLADGSFRSRIEKFIPTSNSVPEVKDESTK